MISATGWTWATVDELTWSQLMDLLRYWTRHPPTHLSVQGIAAGFAGTRLKGRTPALPTGEPSEAKHITSAEELFGLAVTLKGALPPGSVGVVNG